MDTIHDVLCSMYEDGVRFKVFGNELRCSASKGILTTKRLEVLRELKDQIILALERTPGLHLEPRNSSEPAPLSFQQELCLAWMQGSFASGPCTFSLLLRGSLSAHVLWQSLNTVLQRHQALRTRISTIDGVLKQVIDESAKYQLQVVSLVDVAGADSYANAEAYVNKLVARRVEISVGPLFEAVLLQLGKHEHVLAVVVDHLVTDGMSMTIFFRELWKSYRETARGREPALPKVSMQYGDYAVWQRNVYILRLEKNQSYWKGRLAGAVFARLPADGGLSRATPMGAERLQFFFGETLSTAIEDLARDERTTPFVVVLASYAVLLSCWCNQTDLIVVVVTARSRAEHFNTIGWLAQEVPIRIKLIGNESFLDLLKMISQEVYLANEHIDCEDSVRGLPEFSKGSVISWLSKEFCTAYEHLDYIQTPLRDPAGIPTFDDEGACDPGFTIESFQVIGQSRDPGLGQRRSDPEGSVRFSAGIRGDDRAEHVSTYSDIALDFAYSIQGISGFGYYRSDLFRPETIKCFLNDFWQICVRVARDPLVSVNSLKSGRWGVQNEKE